MENKYRVFFNIEEEGLNEIMEKLQTAISTIYDCYSELEKMGLVIKEKEETETKED